MRGWDFWAGFGEVLGFDFGVTDVYQDQACTISLVLRKRGGFITNARINFYGEKVADCRKHLEVGMGVMVKGELMNRRCNKINDRVLEIRGHEIEFNGRSYDWRKEEEKEDRG